MEMRQEDRRIRRSRRLLKHALAELMQEKEFQDITVKDITERADLNRGTFYLHYTGTYELLEKIEDEILSDFQRMIDAFLPNKNTGTLYPIIRPIADYIVENADICRSLFENKASGDFWLKFRDLIYRNGMTFIRTRFGAVDVKKCEYLFGFLTFGVIGVLKQWFEDGLALSKQEMTEMIDKSITGAANALLMTQKSTL